MSVVKREAPIAVTADDIAGCLARSTFKDALVVVDRCSYLGDEADLLVVPPCLRFVDVEVKISRADLKADRRKDKWHQIHGWRWQEAFHAEHGRRPARDEIVVPRDWPRRVWKHYYAMPAAIWRAELLEFCGATSGVLLVHPRADAKPRWWRVEVVRRAKPNRAAPTASPTDLMHVARLASLRMWDAYAERAEQSMRVRSPPLSPGQGDAAGSGTGGLTAPPPGTLSPRDEEQP